jgi:hypothetical protein
VQQSVLPGRIIDRGLCEDRVVIEVMVRKYTDHLPLFRQAAAFLRDAGINLSRKTLSGWVMRAGELLVPVNAAIYREVAAGGYMQVDESPVPVSDPDIPGANGRGWWWMEGSRVRRMPEEGMGCASTEISSSQTVPADRNWMRSSGLASVVVWFHA